MTTMKSALIKNTMDRGSASLKSHCNGLDKMEIRQTRRGWLQTCFGCDAKTEFKYFVGSDQIAISIEDTDCFCCMCCNRIHPFKMAVKELYSGAELVSVDRPLACVQGPCKCCCYQSASFTSANESIGKIEEQFYFCVPRFLIYDGENRPMYKLHNPTCFGGTCVNCCAEGNPCGKGCCKVSFRVYDADQQETDGDAPYLGYILKKPKSLFVELFTDANAFEVIFPQEATTAQKGVLIGTSIFLNAIFFEENGQE
eukprot:scaffold2067_cov101-Cylindrotheca_fusiformis.AAC.1